MSGCGCNAKRMKKEEEEEEYEAEDDSVCGLGKEAYAERESALYDTLFSLGAGVVGFFVTSYFNVENSYSKAGIVVASVVLGNVVVKGQKLGNRVAGMRFDMMCKGDE